MRYFVAILVAGAAIVLAGGGQGDRDAPPRPSVVPLSWDLEFDYQHPQIITLAIPGQAGPQTFWYMIYTVVNRTGADQMFVPHFTLYTDTGEVQRAGLRVPAMVFTAIKKRHKEPLLMNVGKITGRILQGEDNGKDGVAIWRDYDPAARNFDIFVGGLSGERTRVKLPAPIIVTERDEDGRAKKVTKTHVILAKALRLNYSLPGEASARVRNKPKLRKKEWVMR